MDITPSWLLPNTIRDEYGKFLLKKRTNFIYFE